jgi:signal transduction histidine kinase/CheY-like chemotaxis protein
VARAETGTGLTPASGPTPVLRPWHRLRSSGLGTKLVLFSTLLTVVAVATGFLVLSIEIRRNTKRMIADAMAHHQRMILNLQKRSLEQLIRTSTLMTGSPTLRAAMETYQSESPPGDRPRPDLLSTIQKEAERIAGGLGRDLLIVTDENGRVLATDSRDGEGPAIGDDLSSRSIVLHALQQDAPIGDQNFAVLSFQGRHFQVGCVPIVLQGFIIGTLTLGDRIDQRFVLALRQSFDTEIAVTLGSNVIASTLAVPEADGSDLEPPAAAETGAVPAPSVVRLGEEEYVTARLPLGTDGAGRPVTLHLLHSLNRAIRQSNGSLSVTLLSTGALAVILAGVAAWLVSRSILRPFDSFVGFMRSVAETGDRSHRFDSSRASIEVRTLNETYNHLIESLVEHEQRLLLSAREELVRLERLKESEKLAALGRLLSGAAHEINNPLTGVVGNIEILLTDEHLDPGVRRRLQKVGQEGQRIVALVRNLLKIAHRDGGQRALLDLNQVIRDTVALRQHDFATAGMRVDLDLGAGPIWLQGNELELQQVFLNIINNAYDALKETRGQPTLNIRTSTDDAKATITFSDNGPGMASPKQVFDHFYTTKKVGQGTGLGLSISYAIVHDHGGQITAENRPEGGARFSLVLPRSEGEETVRKPPRQATAPGPREKQPLTASVLVVDDEPSVLELQMEILRSVGAAAVGVETGEEAIELLRQREFDLVVSDLKMPGEISGEDLFYWVEANRPAAARGFVFVTGDTAAEATQMFLQKTRRPCLLKPFSMDEYLSALKETLHALQPTS